MTKLKKKIVNAIKKFARWVLRQELAMEFSRLESENSSLKARLEYLQNHFLNPKVKISYHQAPDAVQKAYGDTIVIKATFDLPLDCSDSKKLQSNLIIDKRVFQLAHNDIIKDIFNSLFEELKNQSEIQEIERAMND